MERLRERDDASEKDLDRERCRVREKGRERDGDRDIECMSERA